MKGRVIRPSWIRILIATCLAAGVVSAQSRPLRPLKHGAREVGGYFLSPPGEPATSYVAGRAMLLRDPGTLVSDLTQLCASTSTASDSGGAEVRRRVAPLEAARTTAHMRGMFFGPLPPGRYVALAWIELRWPPAGPGDSVRVRGYFGASTVIVEVHTDTVFAMFNTGHAAFRVLNARANALRCLEFLVVPEPAERVVTPLPRARPRGARPA